MNTNAYKSLLNELDAGKKAVMVTIMNDKENERNASPEKIVITEEKLRVCHSIDNLDGIIYQKAQLALESGNIQFVKGQDTITHLMEPYFPEPRLIVLGGGHIAKPLVEFGARLGFLVTVIDDRPSFANEGRFPDAERVICESFERCFDLLSVNESAYVVIVTRGHRHDLDCLRQVLKYRTAYIGMIGSKRRVKSVKEQLLGEGYSQEQLNKVNAPIGLDIGAVTPDEIAISIIAQVIGYRRLTGAASGNASASKINWPELDRAVLEELGKGENDPKAVVTVISTKGSVPRKAGAKMLVWPCGRTLGSIGGGCSEGEIIHMARDILRDGGCRIHQIDMTGQIAEDEGMVCGGIMEVLIESCSEK
ncbi:XdhC family protein [Geosporobacter ferrireducens]|uniref:Xanthine dehydrogenase n=1 Tax=Geosporobacter ferrireducens TaxID=1424294 RepID=A0A1D8GKT0_9FIRM|nr:XdhC/CoxI family protein [Geosporobacter ferrireducens]AOT71472.1 xanthine dehydrogenase [Geosporobacter ferrireducens]MTI57781.1 xanthine dehydrogenase [Geosporobacter ferrireducens]